MKRALERGAIQGLLTAGAAFLVVNTLGYNTTSLTVLLYMFLIFGAFFELKNTLQLGLKDLFGEVVVVAEEEEKTLNRIFRDKKYRVNGELEEI
ncbi:hypothetical protein AQV86_00655 [Nanohaloarchaea archaeon SG9]|nr:hypothetical protein AQV86_00655 [Nanohaloarchaea archaeon SG9]